jgi:hypothetical protein
MSKPPLTTVSASVAWLVITIIMLLSAAVSLKPLSLHQMAVRLAAWLAETRAVQLHLVMFQAQLPQAVPKKSAAWSGLTYLRSETATALQP